MRQVILIPDETGGYVVEVPSLPGCYSQGETEAEALANIKEAIELHIEDMLEAGEEIPDDVPAPILPKLPVVNARECIRALEKIGFYIARQKGSHITLRRDDPKGRVTVPNHNPIKPGMLRRVIKDAGLTVDEFIALL
jgi:predicted RNase H-like HicB family nuclease